MNLNDGFEYRTFAFTVESDNGDDAESTVANGLRDLGINGHEFRVLWHEALTIGLTMVTVAVHTVYMQDLPRLIERGIAEDIEEVSVQIAQ